LNPAGAALFGGDGEAGGNLHKAIGNT